MNSGLAFGLGVVAVAGAAYLYDRFGKRALASLLNDLNGLVTKLEDFKAQQELEIASHLEEIALHQGHVQVKGSERDRAIRIRDRITELLQ